MPPYRRNRWIVGALLRPTAMIAFAYAYTKPYSYPKKIRTIIVVELFLETIIAFFVWFVLKSNLRSFEGNTFYKLLF